MDILHDLLLIILVLLLGPFGFSICEGFGLLTMVKIFFFLIFGEDRLDDVSWISSL